MIFFLPFYLYKKHYSVEFHLSLLVLFFYYHLNYQLNLVIIYFLKGDLCLFSAAIIYLAPLVFTNVKQYFSSFAFLSSL